MQLCSSIANAKKSFMKMKWWKENNGVDPSGSKNSDILSIYLSTTLLPATRQSYFWYETLKECVGGKDKMVMSGSWVAECCCRYRSLNLPRLKERPSVKCLISTIFFFFFPEAKLLHFDNNGSITSTKCQISEIRASLALYYCRLVSFLFI